MNSMFTKIIRIALGLALVIFGANKLFHFIPMEAPTSQFRELNRSEHRERFSSIR